MAVVWQLSILHLNKRALLSGVLLMDKPFIYDKKISSFRNLLKVVKSYFIDVCKNREITITTGNKKINTQTDEHGGFSVDLDYIPKGEYKINFTGDKQTLEFLQTYPIVFKNTKGSFDVISDIDDTIIYSFTASFFKRIGNIAFTVPSKRKPIEFTQNLLEEFKKQDSRVIYISKSESNLFGLLSTFIEKNNLPKGPLFLTPYLKFSQLFKSKKHNFKIENIRFVLKNSGNKKFVLFGDDSQKDMEIYANIANYYPDRISKIYIRQTKMRINKRKQLYWKSLKEIFPGAIYFNKKTDINTEIESLKKLIQ